MLGGQLGDHGGTEAFSEVQDAVRWDALRQKECARRSSIEGETGLGGAARIAAVPAVVQQQDAQAALAESARERRAPGSVAAVARRDEYGHRALRVGRGQVPSPK